FFAGDVLAVVLAVAFFAGFFAGDVLAADLVFLVAAFAGDFLADFFAGFVLVAAFLVVFVGAGFRTSTVTLSSASRGVGTRLRAGRRAAPNSAAWSLMRKAQSITFHSPQ